MVAVTHREGDDNNNDNSTYAYAYSIIITFVWFMVKRRMEGERCGDHCYLFSSFDGDNIYLLGFYFDFTILCA